MLLFPDEIQDSDVWKKRRQPTIVWQNIIKKKKRNSLKYWKIKTFSVSSWKYQMIFVFSFQRPNRSKSWVLPNWMHGKQRRSWFVVPPEEMYRLIGDLEETLFQTTIRWGMTALSRLDIGRPGTIIGTFECSYIWWSEHTLDTKLTWILEISRTSYKVLKVNPNILYLCSSSSTIEYL